MFEVQFITPVGDVYESSVKRLSLPTVDGIRTILANHIDTVIPLKSGRVKIIRERDEEMVDISEGLFYFSDNDSRVFVRRFERVEEN